MTAMTQSHQFRLPNSFIFDPISPKNSFSLKTCCPYVHPNRFHSHKPIITCARSSNKGLFGSQRSRKTLIQFVRFAASNLHYVLPEPLNSVMREFGGGSGSGGSGGSWNGFGWGGFDGGGGRKRRVNRKSQFWFWGFATVCCLGFWALILGGELELKSDVLLGALCLSMLLVLLRNGCVPEWVLGFCSGAAVVGMSLHKKDELQRFVKGFKAMGISRRRQRGRRAL
ncbi:unnamed protein product [Lactuca virosa]|uniref:Uncharacterized protein n=1 Tax=Lactuca virosa TaxID=75947 RepID=A0AAU9NG46_9ASTR|nr:unnamed protein product [Lactuca virosa]